MQKTDELYAISLIPECEFTTTRVAPRMELETNGNSAEIEMKLRATPRTTRNRLGEILLRAGIISPEVLTQSLLIAERSCLPIGRVLVMSGHISTHDVECSLQAQSHIREQSLEYEVAMQLLKFAHKNKVTIEEAHRMHGVSTNCANLSRLARLLFAAGLVSEQDLTDAVAYGRENECPIGMSLSMLDRVSHKDLVNAMNVQLMIRCRKLTFLDAVKTLTISRRYDSNLEHALMALGQPADFERERPRVGQLLVAAGLLSRVDALVVLEFATETDKQYGALLSEHGLVESRVVDAALKVQAMFDNPDFTRARAVRLLKMVQDTGNSLEHVMSEYDLLDQIVSLLEAAGVVSQADLDRAGSLIEDRQHTVAEYLVSSGEISMNLCSLANETLEQILRGTLSYEQGLARLSTEAKVSEPELAA